MRKLKNFFVILLLLVLGACDTSDADEAMMQGFFEESLQLLNYTKEEVYEFGDKFVRVTTEKPELQSNHYYKPTKDNLWYAGYEFGYTLQANDDWQGEEEHDLD